MASAGLQSMKLTTLLTVTAVVLGLSAVGLHACKSFGVFATAEDQKSWESPCGIRGPQYDTPCVDDPTVEGAELACPCAPATLYHLITGTDAGATDVGTK